MNDIEKIIEKAEMELKEYFFKINQQCYKNSCKVLDSFRNNKVSTEHLNGTNGYGYNDIGRDVIEKIFAEVLNGEDALVRSQIISGTHALSVGLFACLRPNDEMLCITGTPYDTLHEVIGIKENKSSLKSYGIKYNEISLVNNDFNIEEIISYIKNRKVKVLYIQRSKGYSTRKTISIKKIEKVIKEVRRIDKEIIIMVDNCYCEFVEEKTPLDVGADLIIGSLIKNLGGGVAPNGGYICGNKELVYLCSERLNIPGEAKEVGSSLNINKEFLKGIYLAPSVVASALKISVLTSYILEKFGYQVEPKYNEERSDIVQSIIFEDENKLIKYCQGIQKYSCIDSYVLPQPAPMPGYDDKIIMASGSFIQGSSIEISCDGPIRFPYIAYQQGGLTYEYGKLALISALKNIQQ